MAQASATPDPGWSNPLASGLGGGKTRIKAKKGRPWVLDAMKVVWDDPTHKARVTNVDWTLPPLDTPSTKHGTSDTSGGIRVQAPAAWFKMEQEQIDFDGPVKVTKPKSEDKLTIRHLVWSGKTHKFVGTGGVRWARNGTVVTGDRLEAGDDLQHVVLSGHVEASAMFGGQP